MIRMDEDFNYYMIRRRFDWSRLPWAWPVLTERVPITFNEALSIVMGECD